MTKLRPAANRRVSFDRRTFLATGAASVAGAHVFGSAGRAQADAAEPGEIVVPPAGKRILLSCKLTMIEPQSDDEPLAARLRRAAEAGAGGTQAHILGGLVQRGGYAGDDQTRVRKHRLPDGSAYRRRAAGLRTLCRADRR